MRRTIQRYAVNFADRCEKLTTEEVIHILQENVPGYREKTELTFSISRNRTKGLSIIRDLVREHAEYYVDVLNKKGLNVELYELR